MYFTDIELRSEFKLIIKYGFLPNIYLLIKFYFNDLLSSTK